MLNLFDDSGPPLSKHCQLEGTPRSILEKNKADKSNKCCCTLFTVNSYSTYSTENSGISIVMQGALKKSCFPVKPESLSVQPISFAEPPHCFVLIEKECMGGHGSSMFQEKKRVPLLMA